MAKKKKKGKNQTKKAKKTQRKMEKEKYFYVNDERWGNEAAIVSENEARHLLDDWWRDEMVKDNWEMWEADLRKCLKPLGTADQLAAAPETAAERDRLRETVRKIKKLVDAAFFQKQIHVSVARNIQGTIKTALALAEKENA